MVIYGNMLDSIFSMPTAKKPKITGTKATRTTVMGEILPVRSGRSL
ncbi:hypothetical protein HMPREF0298_1994 [Corynebacterium lipophiloflavum DSM 44291]|uniref:Uncharacterized protein n=1 Tax=Corynebacterium lipophiloflavum (strain ATCC 700352 / DSM 44291 / CCUG 37336 / JCM 10383 / DMMZ 1944) TaxID=525263 RepID=C0XU74_CORLD|nr:hypothetical protein HMPREF0298_1994 [Corynebacterium lipophiloflavum DSM 44291]